MKLYSAWYCPFAQRAWMTLVHKQIEFEYREVDPYRESGWWMNISRGEGLVPVLLSPDPGGQRQATIIESNRVIEYLDHLEPGSDPLFSDEPDARAEQKYWMDTIGNKITPVFYQLLKTPDHSTDQTDLKKQLLKSTETVTAAMDQTGPFFNGKAISAVDISWFPIAYRIDLLLGHYRKFEIPRQGEAWQRYRSWFNAMCAQPAFVATAYEQGDYDDRLITHYLSYTQEQASDV